MQEAECLNRAIARYRRAHGESDPLAPALERLQREGWALWRVPEAEHPDVRRCAADFIVDYVEHALDDHRICDEEMGRIATLKSIFAMREGDLHALNRHRIAELVALEMERMLIDERVEDAELLQQAALQRALDLGFDQFLALARAPVERIVERLLAQARQAGPEARAGVLRRIGALQTVVRIDTTTLTATWPGASP
ncbi:hypothetical protein [Luteimonas huabeiensis]|uniref:hypothetical protein n=1 Tax=Luteimonas huabeiensis TaxID=1244513 RepID=UPI0004653B1B|nr:hypothetical protein [Luteimonas huabeiensis]